MEWLSEALYSNKTNTTVPPFQCCFFLQHFLLFGDVIALKVYRCPAQLSQCTFWSRFLFSGLYWACAKQWAAFLSHWQIAAWHLSLDAGETGCTWSSVNISSWWFSGMCLKHTHTFVSHTHWGVTGEVGGLPPSVPPPYLNRRPAGCRRCSRRAGCRAGRRWPCSRGSACWPCSSGRGAYSTWDTGRTVDDSVRRGHSPFEGAGKCASGRPDWLHVHVVHRMGAPAQAAPAAVVVVEQGAGAGLGTFDHHRKLPQGAGLHGTGHAGCCQGLEKRWCITRRPGSLWCF